jgi:hypothetical protein
MKIIPRHCPRRRAIQGGESKNKLWIELPLARSTSPWITRPSRVMTNFPLNLTQVVTFNGKLLRRV